MNKLLLKLMGLFIFSVCCLNSFAQTSPSDQAEDEVKILLCHKWEIMSVEEKGKKTLMPKGQKGFFIFRKNGIMTMGELGSKPSNYYWRYDHQFAKLIVSLKIEEGYFNIVSISKNELVISHDTEGYISKIVLKRPS